jgi:hypothetical protein
VDAPVKSTGAKNWNSTWMVRIGDLYANDARVVSQYYPQGRTKHIWANFAQYFFPAEDVDPFTNTSNHEIKALMYRDEVSGYFAVLLALLQSALLQSAWLNKIPQAGARHGRFDDSPEKDY